MSFKIYKRGQGYYTRLWSGLLSFAVVMIGCYILYGKLQATNIWVSTLVPAGIAVVFGLFLFWLVNKPSVADFMIAAEGELKKVSWSSRKEIVASTFVVIFVMASLGLLLLATDFVFRFIFMEWLKIY